MNLVLNAIAIPGPATLKKYGFGRGPAALATDPEQDWIELLQGQDGKCGVCARTPKPSAKTGKVRFVTDHEHVKGWKNLPPEQRRQYVRGLTCWWCNHAYLGRGITIEIAEGVVRFLKRYAKRRPA